MRPRIPGASGGSNSTTNTASHVAQTTHRMRPLPDTRMAVLEQNVHLWIMGRAAANALPTVTRCVRHTFRAGDAAHCAAQRRLSKQVVEPARRSLQCGWARTPRAETILVPLC